MNTWLLLDVSYLAYRALFTTGKLVHGDVPTGVAFGVFRDVVNLRKQHNTANCAFCFDVGTPKRKQVCPSYKANHLSHSLSEEERRDREQLREQVRRLRLEWLPACGFTNILGADGYEADDLMAAVVEGNRDARFVCVTADQDMYQLLRHDNVSCWNPRVGVTQDRAWFEAKYGISPDRWVEVKALAGCSSDNIRGVRGVGEITAIKYLRGELVNPKNKALCSIRDSGELIESNRRLVTLPWPGTPVWKLERDRTATRVKWDAVMQQLGISRLLGGFGT